MNIKTRQNNRIQKQILLTLLLLACAMTLIVAGISITVNISNENRQIDKNLQNIAQAVSSSEAVAELLHGKNEETLNVRLYLDSLKKSLSDIDIISVVGIDGIRKYHTNPELIGSIYDGTKPDFSSHSGALYVTSDIGPSGSQRRAYAAVYGSNGEELGFVLAVMLRQNINRIILSTVTVQLISVLAVIGIAVILSNQLSKRIKKILHGYEPDTFSAMFSVRDSILESLEEGIVALDNNESIIYMNKSASKILDADEKHTENKKLSDLVPSLSINKSFESDGKLCGMPISVNGNSDIIADLISIREQNKTVGALVILHDRREYTKIMEDLSGVKYMVDSMRANNHDFTNKLHVILGCIQMGRSAEACEYITNITAIQQAVIGNVMKNIEDPSVAALLIGKYARASELNIRFTLKSGSRLNRSDISLPSCDLVTIIGNLLDNATESINEKSEMPKELSIGIFTQPHAMIISVDDTGNGIPDAIRDEIYRNGFSTKGDGRGTGLYVVSNLIEKYGGTITLDSEVGTGTFFTVTLTDNSQNRKDSNNVRSSDS